MRSIKKLISSIKNKNNKIAVIGLGYVGLPLSVRFSKTGFNTLGFDIDEKKVNALNSGKSYIGHIGSDDIIDIIKKGFQATSDFSQISNVDTIIICVPTPLGVHNEPDISYIKNTFEAIKPFLKEYQLLILESTSYPGTTEEIIIDGIFKINLKNKKNLRFKIGENIYVGYSPEREDPGNKKFTTKMIPKVVSGYTKNCLELTKSLYDQIINETVPVSSIKVAEMTKILENIHRSVNIGLVNELKIVADKMKIDIHEVIKAASTKPFGFTPYFPGPGLGGHCIPIDPFYLSWKAKEFGLNTRFIELAGEINTAMPNYVINKVIEGLNLERKSISGSRILLLGLAYKKNIDDTRESPSLKLIELLTKKGADVFYSDPHVKKTLKTRKNNFKMKSIKLDQKSLSSFDLVILATDHDDFNYSLIEKHSRLIVDTRGRFKPSKKVVKA